MKDSRLTPRFKKFLAIRHGWFDGRFSPAAIVLAITLADISWQNKVDKLAVDSRLMAATGLGRTALHGAICELTGAGLIRRTPECFYVGPLKADLASLTFADDRPASTVIALDDETDWDMIEHLYGDPDPWTRDPLPGDRTGFLRLPRKAIRTRFAGLTCSEAAVLLAIWDAWQPGQKVFLSEREIGRRVKLAEASVQRIISRLTSSGRLGINRRRTGLVRSNNAYILEPFFAVLEEHIAVAPVWDAAAEWMNDFAVVPVLCDAA